MPTEGWLVNGNDVGQYARTLINSAYKESPVQYPGLVNFAIRLVASENRQHLAMLPLVSPPNDV